MAKQDLSRYQKGIVSRHYEHYDTKLAQRLTELLSDLFLAEQAAKASPQDAAATKALDKLWARAKENLAKAKVPGEKIDALLLSRRSDRLAQLIQTITDPTRSSRRT